MKQLRKKQRNYSQLKEQEKPPGKNNEIEVIGLFGNFYYQKAGSKNANWIKKGNWSNKNYKKDLIKNSISETKLTVKAIAD